MVFVSPELCCDVTKKFMVLQLSQGNRENRKHALFK